MYTRLANLSSMSCCHAAIGANWGVGLPIGGVRLLPERPMRCGVTLVRMLPGCAEGTLQ